MLAEFSSSTAGGGNSKETGGRTYIPHTVQGKQFVRYTCLLSQYPNLHSILLKGFAVT
jgi:hypothetical protein